MRALSKSEGPGITMRPGYMAGCPACGDSLQTVEVIVPDHGHRRYLYLGWCMDCLEVKASALFDPLPEIAK